MNGDGRPNIGVAGSHFYTVFGSEGNVLWSQPIKDFSSHLTGSSVFDFDGDGTAEVVYNDELNLRVYRGADGTVLFETPNSSATAYEFPVIADIDKDNHADIIVSSSSGNTKGIRVFEDSNNSWMATRSIWNQHSYHINNINDDGTIPQFEQPSWLTHNSYRLNTFADRDPTLLTDLTASVLSIHDKGDNQPASISVRIGNAGAGDLNTDISITFYQGDPEENGQLLGTRTINNLAKGAYQDIELTNIASLSGAADIYVIADQDNLLTECNETNNRVVLPVLPQTSTGQMTVTTDQLVYGPDSPVQIQLEINNSSGVPGEYKATVVVEDEQGNIIQSYPTYAVGPLAGGDSAQLSELWETARYQTGTYLIKGLLFNLNDEVIQEVISPIEISAGTNGDAIVSLRTTTDKIIYHTEDSVQLSNLVQNLTVNEIITEASLEITVTDPIGASVYTETLTIESLLNGAVTELTSIYSFTQITEGTYTVTTELLNSAGDLLITDQAQFEVQVNLQQLLTGDVQVQTTQLDSGQSQICTETLINKGANDLIIQPLRQLLINLDTGATITETEQTLTLTAEETRVETRTIETSGLPEGTYACVLTADIEGQSLNLGAAGFDLQVPPIQIDSQLNTGTPGRLLILLDDPEANANGNSNDRHGAGNGPDLDSQRDYLQATLTAAEWPYTIVTDKDEFASELSSGLYSIYALFAEQEKLDEQVQKQLREAIYKGDGLLQAGAHDHRYNQLDEALGVVIRGSHNSVSGLEFRDSELPLTGITDWYPDDKTLRAEQLTAQIVGDYLGLKGNQSDTLAIARHAYGEGRTIFIGFDLLLHAAINGADTLYTELLLAALEDIRPETVDQTVGHAIPIQLILNNQGIATQGQVTLTLPTDSQLIEPGTATLTPLGTLTWPFELAQDASSELTLWLSLTQIAEDNAITALIQTGTAQPWQDYESLEYSLATQAAVSLNEVLSVLQQQTPENDYRPALQAVEKALDASEQGQIDKTLLFLLQASDSLIRLDTEQADSVRHQLALVIAVEAAKE